MAVAEPARRDARAPALVSCLCVTENRAAFLPWLLWSFERQTWPNKELVIVDSSKEPFQSPSRNVRVVAASSGVGIAAKRNRALSEASGDYVAWFDDDDWQHPARLEELLPPLLDGTTDVAGGTSGWFLDLWKNRCAPYHPTGALIFNSCVIRAELARGVSFDERVRRASDTPWMLEVRRRARGRLAALPRRVYSSWLCHDANVSNPRTQRRCVLPLSFLRESVGSDAWDSTERELDALRARLSLEKTAAQS